jgi:hypothetical protein
VPLVCCIAIYDEDLMNKMSHDLTVGWYLFITEQRCARSVKEGKFNLGCKLCFAEVVTGRY